MHGRRSFPFFGGRMTPTRKVIRKATSVKDLRILSEKVILEKVFGLTTLNSNGLACNPVTGIVAYLAGCVIVLLDPYTNTQSHIFNPEKKTLTALAFSSDGKYLASGECGHNPCVRIWELGDTPSVVTELKGHKYAINCVAFSPNLKYLASIGDQHDMNVNIWNWRTGSKAACNKIGAKVRSVHFSENGSYLVTVGNRHVKYWYFDTEGSSKLNIPTPLQGRSGILGDQKNNYFCDVVCGVGKNSSNTYCITKSGKLCAFSPNRLLDRWVELRCTGANCLAANEDNIFCGCSNGFIRVFDTKTLKFICTLPKPHCLGVDIAKGLDASHMVPKTSTDRYPDVLAMVLDSNGKRLTCIYNDHSMYIWDVRDVKKVGKSASYLYHSGCIWGIESYPVLDSIQNPVLPPGSFLTCSSDDTIRVWNIEDGSPSNKTFPRNIYSKESLKIVYADDELTNIQDMSGFIAGAESKSGIRCLKVSPDGQLLAAGDRSGNLRVYDLQFVDELIKINAHDSEILCVEFSPIESGHKLLVTSSRDRLMHIFDVNQDFALIQTIDDHSSSITAVRFNYDNETFQLLSCGADKNIMFHNAQMNNNGTIHFVRNTIVVGKATMYDMDIEPTRKFAATVGTDRNVRIYDIQGAKQTQCYKGSLSDDGTVIKIRLDPSGLYAATSCSDKSVCVYEFESGDCNAVMYGHSELVLGLLFTVDGSKLISVSGDGCLFVWRLPSSFKQGIIARLQDLGKPLPEVGIVDDDPLSSIRRTTFWVPPKESQGLKENTEGTEFEEAASRVFEESDDQGHGGSLLDYRFSVGRLPAWAKKQIIGDESNPGEPIVKEFQAPTLPAGRWGQRIGKNKNGLAARLDEPSFTCASTTDTLEASLGPVDEYSSMDSHFLTKAKSVPNLSLVHDELEAGQDLLCVPTASPFATPYSSHKRERRRKDETFSLTAAAGGVDDHGNGAADQVIYPPTSQDDFDEEVASSFEVTANRLPHSPTTSEVSSPPLEHYKKTTRTSPKSRSNGHGKEVEEDELGSDLDVERAGTDGEAATSDDEDHSPLTHHFECLASDVEILDEKEEAEAAPEVKERPPVDFDDQMSLHRSFSAKFYSRSHHATSSLKTAATAEQQLAGEHKGSLTFDVDLPEAENLGTAQSSELIPEEQQNHVASAGFGRESETELNQNGGKQVVDEGEFIPLNEKSLEFKSPAESPKSTSDLIALFNQRSSTPTHHKEKKYTPRCSSSQGSALTPALSPVGSPKRRHASSPEKGVRFDLSPQGITEVPLPGVKKPAENGNHVTLARGRDPDTRLHPVRPSLNKGPRPKSLILPQPVVFEINEEAEMTKALSDTELDDQVNPGVPVYKRNKKKARTTTTPTKGQSETFVTRSHFTREQKEIDIDEQLSNGAYRGSASHRGCEAQTSPVNEIARGSVSSFDKLLARQQVDQILCEEGSSAFQNGQETGFYDSTPPERDVGPLELAGKCTEVDVNANKMLLSSTFVPANGDSFAPANGDSLASANADSPCVSVTKPNKDDGIEEMEVSVENCTSIISDLMNSFKQVTIFQNSVLLMPTSALRREVLGMLSGSYNAIETHIRKFRERTKDGGKMESDCLWQSSEFDDILKSIDDLNAEEVSSSTKDSSSYGDNNKHRSVVHLLETYSEMLVSLVNRRLDNDREADAP